MSQGKRTPSAIKKLQGTDQPCRMNPNEPNLVVLKAVSCPPHLEDDDVAKETWEWLIPVLSTMRVLTVADIETVEAYCCVVSDLREMRASLKKHGRLVYTEKMGEDGNKFYEAKTNPLAGQYKGLLQEKRMYGGLLGLDPSNRTKLSAAPEGDDDPLEGL